MTPRERKYHRRKREGTNNLKPVFFKHRAVFADGKKTEWFLDSEIDITEDFGPILYSLPEEIAFEQLIPKKKDINL